VSVIHGDYLEVMELLAAALREDTVVGTGGRALMKWTGVDRVLLARDKLAVLIADLMRHLVRLVTPPGGTVLDPFLGSGSTGLACEMEGFRWVGIEREAEYVAIAEARLNGTQRGLGIA